MAESTIITGQFVRISQTPASIGEIEMKNGVQEGSGWKRQSPMGLQKRTWNQSSMTWRELPAGSWDLRQRISGRLWMK